MTIREAILTAHILDMSTVCTDTRRPSTAAITAARQKLNSETLGQWSVPWQKSIIAARKMIVDHA
jgi:hypothetical protein